MTDQESVLQVERAICNVLRVSGPGIQPGTRLIGDLGAESVDLLGLGCDLQKAVNADVDFRKLFRTCHAGSGEALCDLTVQDLARYLKMQVERRAQETESRGIPAMTRA